MAYLQPSEYINYGLPAGTSADWITAASALINSYCRRSDLNPTQYTERLRLTKGALTVRLTYLPLVAKDGAASPLIAMEGRYGQPRRGEIADEILQEFISTFSIPGQWTTIDTSKVDFDAATGELSLPSNVFGLPYNELSITYTAGLTAIGDDVKSACAQLVRNAQSTPALNASRAQIDSMQMQYFSSSLVDETVKAWLRPYVASRVG